MSTKMGKNEHVHEIDDKSGKRNKHNQQLDVLCYKTFLMPNECTNKAEWLLE